MSPKCIIQEGALFIADAHDSAERSFFFQFLQEIHKNPPPQLFLMGDMFDLLVGNVRYGVQCYAPYIVLINELSLRCEVFYFEGNHDFNLASLFPHAKVIAIEEQPFLCELPDGKSCLLLHGDKYGTWLNRLYTSIIRNPIVLSVLNFLDEHLDFRISKTIQNNQKKKKLCRPLEGFATQIQHKLHFYPKVDVIAEGHYHQNTQFMVSGTKYINFSSFACNQSYFSVQSSPETEFAQKQLRGCNG